MSWIKDKSHVELARIREARDKQVYPYFRPMESGGLHTSIGGNPIINFSSNDYLAYAGDPRLARAAARAAMRYGTGAGASPLISGHLRPLRALERDRGQTAAER